MLGELEQMVTTAKRKKAKFECTANGNETYECRKQEQHIPPLTVRDEHTHSNVAKDETFREKAYHLKTNQQTHNCYTLSTTLKFSFNLLPLLYCLGRHNIAERVERKRYLSRGRNIRIANFSGNGELQKRDRVST